MKYFLFLIFVFGLAFVLTNYGEFIHEKLVKSCESTSGSYLGGMCVHIKVQDPVYEWCLSEVRTQEGSFAVLPSRCGKYAQDLFDNQ